VRAFVHRRGVYVAEMDATERAILAGVVADTAALLGEPVQVESAPAAEDDETGEHDETSEQESHPGLAWSEEDLAEPDDPALARLLPAASDDDEVSAEFRRLTQAELRDAKAQRLRIVWAALRAPGTKLTVQPDQAMDWAAALTDVRLVVSERLGIRTDEDAQAVYAATAAATGENLSKEDEVRLAMASVYSALTWLQESLVQVMLPSLED